MPSTIGPGTPLICINSDRCVSCEEHVDKDAMYTCEDIVALSQLHPFWWRCRRCGEEHDRIALRGKYHSWCPRLFRPLNYGERLIDPVKEFVEEIGKILETTDVH